MSKTLYSKPAPPPVRLGEWLRQLREQRALPLREVAAAAGMDLAHLHKIETGQRVPTEDQAMALGRFFRISKQEMAARRIAERFWREHADDPAVRQAVTMIQETAPAYVVNKSVNKLGKAS
ncbi:MAG: helix-turn-helix domain-containing protein [Verrucomicrobiales bacterium]|nr:helix-turn-helix domain-containing protein [Verrucomicrobiales bacterium]